ncbi:MAG: EamA family transporter [Flavobacteriales bacterium]|nr:EamA family transporter [Flavobacteriales bacterium]
MTRSETIKNYIKLHFIIFIWGFTGVLGKLIESLDGATLAWVRMGVAFIALVAFMIVRKISFALDVKTKLRFLGIGTIIAVHWATFFIAIKVSNVSVALVCMSSSSLFMAFLEPIIFRKSIVPYEILFGIIVIGALFLIFKIEPQYALGIGLAVLSAFLAALFTAINARFIKSHSATQITVYEMLGGFIGLTIFLLISGGFSEGNIIPAASDWVYVLVLSLMCTAYAFVVSVDVMKVVSPFTLAISVNLEPIYAIIMALILFGEEEHMSAGFYGGGLILILTIIANGVMKNRSKNKLKQA